MVAVEISEELTNARGQEIKERCYVRNRLNGNETYVGNVCINRFIRRVEADRERPHGTPTGTLSSTPIAWAISTAKRNTPS